MPTTLTICDTCKRKNWDVAANKPTDGERLAELIEKQAAKHDSLRIRRHSCLMGCRRACNLTVQAPGKISYTLGKFAPTAHVAKAIVRYALQHAESETGQVPFKHWPEEIKGHFITRHLPLTEP